MHLSELAVYFKSEKYLCAGFCASLTIECQLSAMEQYLIKHKGGLTLHADSYSDFELHSIWW
eukprot:Gb_20412 [translate_table: standard]